MPFFDPYTLNGSVFAMTRNIAYFAAFLPKTDKKQVYRLQALPTR